MDTDDIDAFLRELSDPHPKYKSQKKVPVVKSSNESITEDDQTMHSISQSSLTRNYKKTTTNPDTDSIDSLLDSLELDHVQKPSGISPKPSNHSAIVTRKQPLKKSISDEELDDLLNDTPGRRSERATMNKPSPVPSTSSKPKQKCAVINLSPTPSESPESCQSLRCISCDFPVLIITERLGYSKHAGRGVEWYRNVDYLFFRNHYPDTVKLEEFLMETEYPSAAYCCQCAWVNIRQSTPLSSIQKEKIHSKWVCRGH
ncbi:hypothetical protein BCR33DRAFT_761274 [Rhizoclosmatium globosum]|uniref:Cilia- and flagella-associated protein 418 n=1 Tax=Rhizoclosmatium globosum TaxID=329046 RepID=A0A1Y2D0Z3_9FUNG|nr:hypothetical protein BCR33DRAFT_761274 [Rhizoclosmatium globosum]|eukprot:ORY52930.1 hypothetical protein BCR33DRAFT_761274 [Rhizoclosmatium globosum]